MSLQNDMRQRGIAFNDGLENSGIASHGSIEILTGTRGGLQLFHSSSRKLDTFEHVMFHVIMHAHWAWMTFEAARCNAGASIIHVLLRDGKQCMCYLCGEGQP